MLGEAKSISYEDIKEARGKDAAKEAAIAGKGQYGRKPKSPILESDASGLVAPVGRMIWESRFTTSVWLLEEARAGCAHSCNMMVVSLSFVAVSYAR